MDLISLLQTPYCERTGPGIFAEPLNALSNLGFLIAALLAASIIRRRRGASTHARALPWSLAEVALASGLYHTLRGPLSFALDALSLLLFVVLAVLFVLREAHLPARAIAILTLIFIGGETAALFLLPQPFLNGSVTYLLMLALLLLLMGLVAREHRQLVREMIPIALLFGLAILFRTIDPAVCPRFPAGTHFLWHLTAAGAAFYVIRFALLLEADRPSDTGRRTPGHQFA